MLAIKTENLSKKYGQTLVVDKANLAIKKDAIVGLVGPNGSGKTTIMRMICGLLKPTGGKVKINGFDVDGKLSKIQNMIGYLPQQNALFPELNLYENLYYFGTIYGVSDKKVLDQRIRSLLERLELKGEMTKKVENLSGGFQRRAAIACSLLHDPDVLILDEPTIGLDPVIRLKFWDLFKDFKKQGKSILISTHYMEEADDCDEVVVLNAGKLVDFDQPDRLRKKVFGNIYDGNHSRAKIRFEEVYLKLTR